MPPSPHPEGHATASPVEWGAAALSAALVLAVAGLLLYEALGEAPTPPDVHVTAAEVHPAGPGYLVEFEAENRGTTTAAAVEIEGALGDETASATLDYLPAEGTRRGGLYFSSDPRGGPLELRAVGYKRP